MATLTGQFISQSYGGLIQLSTNTGITTGSNTQLQDGLGTNLGVFLNGQGDIAAADISLTGSEYLIPISGTYFPFSVIEAANSTFGARGNIITLKNNQASTTGSVIISGSSNFISLTNGFGGLANFGYGSGYIADNSVILGDPWRVTGSFGSGYDRRYPTVYTSTVLSGNGAWEIRDNRPSGSTGNNFTLNGAIVNGAGTVITSTGSISLSFSLVNAASVTLTKTGSFAGGVGITGTLISGNANRVFADTNASGFGVEGSAIIGQQNEVYISGSFIRANGLQMLGQNLVATGSANDTAQYGGVYVGRFNAADSTSQQANTSFAVGTGTGTGARRTSLHVSSSGLTTVRNGLEISGSIESQVGALTITSQTASMDLSTGNLFTLTLVSGSNTHINPTNLQRGQTSMLQITQPAIGSGTVTFNSLVKFPGGSVYTPTATSSSIDNLSFVSYDGTTLNAVASYNFL
jgi:hypothetical protein